MPPVVFNAVPSQLTQVTMQGSVGRLGRNLPADVRIVQSLLNTTQPGRTPLRVDGAAGPLTVGAIEAFQRQALGAADGRVDVGGRTIRALGNAMQLTGGSLSGMPGTARPSAEITQAVTSGSKHFAFGMFRPSTWKLSTSAGLSASIGPFGAASGTFVVEEDVAPFRRLRLSFVAAGVGLSVAPAGFEESRFELPSVAGRIVMGPFFTRPNLEPADFIGVVQILEVSAGPGSKQGGGIVSFVEVDWGGPKAPIAQGSMTSRANGTPNAGISLMIGRVNSATPA